MDLLFVSDAIPDSAIVLNELQNYNPWLVFLSYFIAFFGSYMAITVLGEAKESGARSKNISVFIGSVLMATAIWSMHYVGMLSYNMEMLQKYDPWLTLLSAVAAFIFSFAVFSILTSGDVTNKKIAICALLLGLGVATMHYTGMEAMHVDARLLYRTDLFILSIAIAVVASAAALWIMNHWQSVTKYKLSVQCMAAATMGVAVCGMHYTGMFASVYYPFADCRLDPNQDFTNFGLMVSAISCAVIIICVAFQNFANTKLRHIPIEKDFKRLSGLLVVTMAVMLAVTMAISHEIFTLKDEVDRLHATLNAEGGAARQKELDRASINHIWAHLYEISHNSSVITFLLLPGITALIVCGVIFISGRKLFLKIMQERRFNREVLDAIVEPIFIKNGQHEWFVGNRAFYKMMGLDNTSNDKLDHNYLAGAALHTFDSIEDQGVRDEMVIKHGMTDINEEIITLKNNQQMNAMVTRSPLVLPDETKGLVGIVHDITHLKEVEQQLERHRKNLEDLVADQTVSLKNALRDAQNTSELKSEFLANMSHELRTPLNSILGMSNLLLEGSLSEEQKEMLQILDASSKNLLEIVNDILDLSKIESGVLELEHIPFDAQQTISEVIGMLNPLASRKGLSLNWHAKMHAPVFVIGDPLRYSRIATNLISNAIKYTESGEVNVYLQTNMVSDGECILKLLVQDTGVGIPEGAVDRIFDKFSQADNSTTRKYGGTGLGLAITKQIVEKMDGKIGLVSQPGEGSVFAVTIPFAVANSMDEEKEQIVPLNHCGIIPPDKARILVAEDHPLNQIFVRKLLESLGISRVKLVENGVEAVSWLKENEADIVLMDCHMPEMNGYDATRTIRRLGKVCQSLPIIALTANAMTGERDNCLAAGMDDYLSKPIDKKKLQAVLSNWIRFNKGSSENPSPEQKEKKALSTLNMEAIRSFCSDDPGLEKEFTEIFITQSEKQLKDLSENIMDGQSKLWVETAHLLKGGAATIGAMRLREYASKAQEMFSSTFAMREQTHILLEAEFARVKEELIKQGLYNANEGG